MQDICTINSPHFFLKSCKCAVPSWYFSHTFSPESISSILSILALYYPSEWVCLELFLATGMLYVLPLFELCLHLPPEIQRERFCVPLNAQEFPLFYLQPSLQSSLSFYNCPAVCLHVIFSLFPCFGGMLWCVENIFRRELSGICVKLSLMMII